MLHRQLFICSAIEKCQEKVNCCAHKIPHIKDERCVPRECRYAPGAEIDCDRYDPEKPRVPGPVPVVPAKTVEQTMREKDPLPKVTEMIIGTTKNGLDITVPVDSENVKEMDIKEAVKKAAQRPVTVASKPAKKPAGKKGKVS
jgi:hypothetical protein